MKLLIATKNPDKLKEIRASLSLEQLDLGSGLDYPEMGDVEEDGDTLEANAIKKATTWSKRLGCWALADDTGLEVDALEGAPGVYSARYAGETATYSDNVHKLLHELAGVNVRTARFRSVMALSDPQGNAKWVDGVCDGVITTSARGTGGFGYDPVFLPAGQSRTFAEMEIAEKNKVSHRGRALMAAREAWANLLQQENPAWTD